MVIPPLLDDFVEPPPATLREGGAFCYSSVMGIIGVNGYCW